LASFVPHHHSPDHWKSAFEGALRPRASIMG
jgi:hypothetical protein